VGSLLTPLLVSAGGSTMALIGVGAILPLVFALSGRGVLAIDRAAHVPVVEIALLRSLGAFAALPAPALEGLAAALSPLAVQSGQTLIRQGDEGDRCYAIVEGQLDVTLDGRYVRTVTRGDLVGEIALLRYVPRTASVTAATDCAVLVLTRDAFLTAVVGHAPTQAIANQATDARLDELARIAGDG
jgi:CRP-like cAMP-binding protein